MFYRKNPVGVKAGSIGRIEDSKPNPVETSQPTERPKPDIPVLCLENGGDSILRQSLAGGPFRDQKVVFQVPLQYRPLAAKGRRRRDKDEQNTDQKSGQPTHKRY